MHRYVLTVATKKYNIYNRCPNNLTKIEFVILMSNYTIENIMIIITYPQPPPFNLFSTDHRQPPVWKEFVLILGFKTNQHNNIDIVLLLSDSYLQAIGCNTQHISPLLWWIYIAYHIQRYFRAIAIWHKTTSGAYQADQKKGRVWHYHIFHHGNIATLWTSPNLKLIKVKFIKLVFWFRFLFM